MERSKIRPSDNIRTFYLARFYMEYLLRLRRKEADAAAQRKAAGMADDHGSKRMMPLGLVGEMAEMDSVRWVVMRMKFSMDERVCLRLPECATLTSSHQLGTNYKPPLTASPRLSVVRA